MARTNQNPVAGQNEKTDSQSQSTNPQNAKPENAGGSVQYISMASSSEIFSNPVSPR